MARASSGTPSRARTSASHSALSAAMSTPAGHSVLHALQATHVPSTSRTRRRRWPPSGTAPQMTPCSALARALVERASSRVAAAGGHMVPRRLLAQAGAEAPLDRQAEAALGGVRQPRRPAAVAAVAGAEAQVLRDPRAVDDDAGPSSRRGSNASLTATSAVQPGAEEPRQQPAARAAAAVLARDGAVVLGDQLADLAGQRLHARDAGGGLEVQQRAHVQAARGGVAGERRAHAGAATSAGSRSTKSASRSGATAVSSTNDAGRSAPGAPMSSGSTARRSAAASASAAGCSSQMTCAAPSAAGERAQPREAGARLVLVALVLDREHGRAPRRRAAGPCGGTGQVGRAAQRREVEQLDRRRARCRGWRRWPRARRAGWRT